MDKKERIKRSIIIIIIMVFACLSILSSKERRRRRESENMEIVGNYNVDIIKASNNLSKDKNYLISPYNIEVALNMLREGANGNTKDELDKVLGTRKINNISLKNKLSVANAIFIKDDYKNDIKKDYVSLLDSKYQSEVLYDKFKTPAVINNWVKKKTNGMIDKVVNQISNDFVMGLASALALDVEWTNAFECNKTTSGEFTKVDNSKMSVEMMHQTYKTSAKYFKNDLGEGVILPYITEDDDKELEFVALLPKDSVNNFINSLTSDKLNNLLTSTKEATDKYHINLSLPRFSYSYEVSNFIKVLQSIGIVDAFDPVKANFKKMIEIDENVYVGEAVHKTRIELNEKGTKAAAVTYFGMFKNAMEIENDYEEVNIKFNKPFIYMIREKNTSELLFFGTVFEPNKWEGMTCSN